MQLPNENLHRLGTEALAEYGGRWHWFVTENVGREKAKIEGECAGLSSINGEQRSDVDKLVDEALTSQKDQPGFTRRMSEAILGEARRTVEKSSEDGVIELSASDYSSAPVLVKKSDGTYHMCIDYRTVNELIVKDAYPVGSMDAILDKLRGAKYISKIGLKNVYLQIPMAPASKKYTAFSVPGTGLYHFRTMPFDECAGHFLSIGGRPVRSGVRA